MRVVRAAAWSAGAVVVAAVAFVGWVYAASEARLHRFPAPPAFTTAIPADAASIAHGEHLVQTRGCGGCHGDRLEGALFDSYVAPNIVALAHEESAAAFEAALRHGIDHNGRAVYAMPAYNFQNLRDADVAAIIAYLRSIPVPESAKVRGGMPFNTRLEIALGKDDAIPGFLDRVPALTHQNGAGAQLARGEYIANTSCNECHGFSLRADVPWPGERAPDLVTVIGGYDAAQFAHLMRTGEPIGGRDLELMDDVARSRFVHWTDEEVDDLYAYLRARNAELK